MAIVPKQYFLTKGTGSHEKELIAFEQALRDAGIHMCNLVKISSILPPGCQRISREQGERLLQKGQITFAVLAQTQTNEPGQLIAAGIGVAQPADASIHGYLTESEGVIGREESDVAHDVEEMALENLVTEWGKPFDPNVIKEPGKKHYRLFDRDIEVDHIVQTAKGAPGNQFTVVVTAAIMIY